MVDISAYLTRIRYSGPTDPTAKTLRDLHRAHMFAVPFENLDISRGRKIVIDEGAILQKVVHLRRGGFCYELNCAFAALLRIVEIRDCLQMEKADRAGDWKPQYSFTLQPRQIQEFAGMCHYHQTSPDSSFTQKRVCSLATAEGRITLSELKLIETTNGSRNEKILASEKEWIETLEQRFGIHFES